jgi:hypothetical protein
MAVEASEITDRWAAYNGDCCAVLPLLKTGSAHLSIYSPPFGTNDGGLYQYSDDPADVSNCSTLAEFLGHYEFVVRELTRVTMPGRISCVHCADTPIPEGGGGGFLDFPGEVIRLHQKYGWRWEGRRTIWKEPLKMAIRTRSLGLTQRQIVKDSARSNVAGADYLLAFRAPGTNPVPVSHDRGLRNYYGATPIDENMLREFADEMDPARDRVSQWIWREYASSVWDDIRIGNVLPYREGRESEEEKHIHPLQLDVIARCLELWSNPGETVLTPFMGVGSEVFQSVVQDRRAIGIELKPSYYRQALKNLRAIGDAKMEQGKLFGNDEEEWIEE